MLFETLALTGVASKAIKDPTSQNKSAEDDWLLIEYRTDGKNITRISIYDVKYGRELR